MTEHVLKVDAPYFDALLDGSKTFEVRKNDRGYQAGDTLVLLDRAGCDCTDESCIRRRRPALRKRITFVYSGDPRFGTGGGLQPGIVVLALGEPQP